MPIPAFTEHGLLPAGVHDCTLAEVNGFLCFSEKREAIWLGLTGFLEWINPLPVPDCLLLDGSFVTDKADPNDVDIVIDMTSCDDGQQAEWVSHWDEAHDFAKENFQVDFYPFAIGQGNDFSAFFQYVRVEEAIRRGLAPTVRKGILRTIL